MLLALFTTFTASRKEPLVAMITRVHSGFLAAGLGEPIVRFTLADAPGSPEINTVAAVTGIKQVSSIAC